MTCRSFARPAAELISTRVPSVSTQVTVTCGAPSPAIVARWAKFLPRKRFRSKSFSASAIAVPPLRRLRETEAEIAELHVVDGRRSAGHRVGPRLRLREGDDLGDAVLPGQEHHRAVPSERDAAVGRSTVGEGLQHVAELVL